MDLDDEARGRVEAAAEELAQDGYRVLAVAERRASTRADLDDDRIHDLVLLGLLGLSDPVRPAAAASVARLQVAGIESVMVTGDHPGTARGIADGLGILTGHTVVTGTDLDAWDDDELARQINDVSVFARVTPAHKVRIVEAFQKAGHAVAMTGDGANDAPAIRLADVGIALGEGSTAAARFTGRRQRASTVGLVALVGTQLGQTLVIGGRDPLVIAASVGSMAALAAIVQTPGVSQFFGCTPLGPVGWGQATSAAAAATALATIAPPVLDRLGILTDPP